MKTIIYKRRSKKEIEKGYSIMVQGDRLKEFCKLNNKNISNDYTDDGYSASIKEDKWNLRLDGDEFIISFKLKARPNFLKMIQQCIKDKEEGEIYFTKWDRFSRNYVLTIMIDEFLKRFNKKIISTDEPNDVLMRGILSLFSEKEIEKLKTRINDAFRNKFKRDIYVGRCPFGYKFVGKKENKRLEINEEEASIVKQIFDRTLKGDKWKDICESIKIKVKRKGKIYITNLPAQSYYNILRNKVYIGLIEYKGEVKKGSHTSIIDSNTFNEINKKKFISFSF